MSFRGKMSIMAVSAAIAIYAAVGGLLSPWTRAQQPINDGDGKTPLFPYGFGLTYAQGAELVDARAAKHQRARPQHSDVVPAAGRRVHVRAGVVDHDRATSAQRARILRRKPDSEVIPCAGR